MWTNVHDWKNNGEEWSVAWGGADMQFFGCIYPRIRSYLPAGTILEIATGRGRWTQYLLNYCDKFIGVDLVEDCVEFCKQRFSQVSAKSQFYTNDGTSLDFIEDHSVDFAFSFDSLVHADINVLRNYLIQLKNKLSANGVAFIHHSNFNVFTKDVPNLHWRDTTVSHKLIKDICEEVGLSLTSQELLNWGSNYFSDCFTVVTQKDSVHQREYRLFENPNFMREAEYLKVLAGVYRK